MSEPEPRTPTGKALLESGIMQGDHPDALPAILAIEAEAIALGAAQGAEAERRKLLGAVENEVAYYFDRGHFRGCAMLDTYLDQKDCDCGPLALNDLLWDPDR
jgi:hypothetical protein